MFALNFEAMRTLEARVIGAGTSQEELISRAGAVTAEILRRKFPEANRFVFICGKGNNGNDGRAAAGHLGNAKICEFSDLPDIAEIQPGDVVVDALLGTGCKGALKSPYAEWVDVINNLAGNFVVSLDVPSGGKVAADMTITYGYPKSELFYCASGEIVVADIGLGSVEAELSDFEFSFAPDIAVKIKKIPQNCHKNMRGRVLVHAGSREYPGAGALAAEAALRGGAGLVKLFTPKVPYGALPNALIVETGFPRRPDFADFDAVLAGPGWGERRKKELARALKFAKKLVLDADALNLLAANPELYRRRQVPELVMTPHPGEAARLCRAFGIDAKLPAIGIAKKLAAKLNAVVVLKGQHTVICSERGDLSINSSGNRNLATAGTGDVLAGLLAALLVRHDGKTAAEIGCFIHGKAGENLPFGMIADDLLPEIPHVWRELFYRS